MESFFVRATDRQSIRRAIEIPCCVIRKKDGKVIARQSLDLSPHGMRVELADLDADPGDGFHVCFRATQLQKWFYTDATAARILHGRRPRDRGRSIGLRFDSLDAVSRLILRGALRKVPPPLPQREARVDYAATIRQLSAK